MPAHSEEPLLEREYELSALAAALAAADAGHGRLTIIQGPAGIGKTRLLAAACAAARERRIDVLSARGGSLERDFPFGIVRQLLEPPLRRLRPGESDSLLAGAAGLAAAALGLEGASPAPAQPVVEGPSSFSVLHGLYWLTANLAERHPLLIAVDDAHWADPLSLGFLEFLVRRLAELPALLLIVIRTGEQEAEEEQVTRIAADPAAAILRPAALSEAATAAVVRALLAPGAADEFCRACRAASGGNPFLLHGLIGALKVDGAPPTAAEAARVGGVAPEAVTRALLVRLARLPSAAATLARSVAVLGADAELRHAAAVAGLDDALAADAADRLARAEILTRQHPLEFVHPVVREAIYADLAPGQRSQAHARAAAVLREAHTAPDRIAVQLLASEPGTVEWAVGPLRAAASDALARGAPSAAATYLRRALDEPAPATERAEVAGELGRAEVLCGHPTGIEHLREARATTPAGRARAEMGRALGQALSAFGRFEEAIAAFDGAITELAEDDHELSLALEAEAMTTGRLHPSTYPAVVRRIKRFASGVAGDSPAERMILANVGYQRLLDGGSAADAVAPIERALRGGLVAEQGPAALPLFDALYTTVIAEEVELAERFCSAALDEARARGSLIGYSVVSGFISDLAYRRGNLIDAENHARDSLEAARQGVPATVPMALASLIGVLIERGEADAAAEALERDGTEEIPDSLLTNNLLLSRGRLRLALGDSERGIADLLEAGRREARLRGSNPSAVPYRSAAAVALAALGRAAQARELATEELTLARRWGTPGAIGVAQRALGLAEPGEAGIERLREAAATLARSHRRLEHARALTDLGAAVRRAGRRTEAREPLRHALEIAHRCAATALEDRAHHELLASGARPPRPLRTGLDALTPSERRIARMAADGHSNREIAQALFLSMKTVEMHLGHTYAKLDIHSRAQLPQRLTASEAQPAANNERKPA